MEILRNLKRFLRSEKFAERLKLGQQSTFQAIYKAIRKGMNAFYIKEPSGIGKTQYAIELTNAGQFKKVLFLVPTLALVDQTDNRFRKFGENIVSINNFTGTKKEMDGQIIIGTYQSFQRASEFPIDPSCFDLVIWDEVHEALTPARQQIMNFFDPQTIHLGLTASDEYNELKRVENFMPCIARMTIEEAVKLNLLCGVRCWLAQTNIDISRITLTRGDYDIKEQKRIIDIVRRNRAALDIYSEFFNGQTCLITCINVEHAMKIAEIFQHAGISARAVWGSTQEYYLPKRELQQRLDDFKIGKIKVITTVDLIDKGFDDTLISALINLRITSSVVKATQRGGRVLRLFSDEDKKQPVARKMFRRWGGKLATVVDFLDECQNHSFRPVLFSDILGGTYILPPPMEEHERNIGVGGDKLWPPNGRVSIRLITDLIQVAKITAQMTTFDSLPVANEDGIVFLPVQR